MRALSSYFLITLEEPDLKNISLSDMLILEVFRNTLTAKDKYRFRDLENLLSRIQLQLLFKPKSFSDFSNPFL